MPGREELAGAIYGFTAKGEPERQPDLSALIATARKHLALMPEPCPDEECVNGFIDVDGVPFFHEACHGRGYLYSEALVDELFGPIYYHFGSEDAPECRDLAIRLLDIIHQYTQEDRG